MLSSVKNPLKNSLIRVAKIHLGIVLAYICQIMAYDAAKLITPDVVLKRWYSAAALAILCAVIWYIARSKVRSGNTYKWLTWGIIIADILFAVFNTYTQRGMASRAVLLFIIPIAVAAILVSRVALFSVAIICAAAYTVAAVAYFVNYFNEGYKIELYGEIVFYSIMFFAVAALLWTVIKTKHHH